MADDKPLRTKPNPGAPVRRSGGSASAPPGAAQASAQAPAGDPRARASQATRERRLRDLDNPTASFPIRSVGVASGRRIREDDVQTELRKAVKFYDDDEPELDDEGQELELDKQPTRPKPAVSVDIRFVALWLVAASMLAMLAAVAAATAVLYR